MDYYGMSISTMVVKEKNSSLALCDIPQGFWILTFPIFCGYKLKIQINYVSGDEEPTQDTQKNDVNLSTGIHSRRLFGISIDISNLVGIDEITPKIENYRKEAKISQSPDEKIYAAISSLRDEATTIGSRMNYQAVIGGMCLGKDKVPAWLAHNLAKNKKY